MKISTQILSPIVGVTIFAQVLFGAIAYKIILDDHAKSHVSNLQQMAKTIKNNLSYTNLSNSPQVYVENLHKNFTTSESILVLNTGNKQYIAGKFEQQLPRIYDDVKRSHQEYSVKPVGGIIEVDDVDFHWNTTQLNDGSELLFLESCVAYKSDSHLGTRLLTTSVIIMWIAIWIGLILSHRISRKLNDKNKALKYQAFHDKLTGLPNRLLLKDRLEQALLDSNRSGKPFALLLMDLDHFKDVNDTLGHHFGDELLKQVGVKIKKSLRKNDTLARLGGDEFAAILCDTDLDGVLICIDNILGNMKHPHSIKNTSIESKASIGVAVYPMHGNDSESLLQHADIAMYQAKKNRTGYAIYDSSYNSHSVRRLQLMNELRNSIKNDHICVFYQPMILQSDDRVVSLEALARWNHPELGFISPDEFIPVAEQTGIIRKLTLFVLNTALRDCKRWRDNGYDIGISINISPHCLQDISFPDNLLSIVSNSGMKAENIELEITETALMKDLNSAGEILKRFHDEGYKLSIDDFGTGFSSLEHLKELPVDILKIDKTFVMDMCDSKSDAAIVRSIIELGHNLNCKVIAEGVENEKTRDQLIALNVDVLQGYLYSKAISREELEHWLLDTQLKIANIPKSTCTTFRTYK